MDVRKKLAEIVKKAAYSSLPSNTEDFHLNMFVTNLLAHGVTVQEWIPVTERLPEENHDGSVNAVLVTDGFVQHMAYFARGEWRFAESGEIKEPMWYSITHWMPMPQPPKGE